MAIYTQESVCLIVGGKRLKKIPMTNVNKLTSDYRTTEEYREALTRTVEALSEIQDQLHNCLVDLAISGKWKDWSDKLPEGTEFTFTEDMLST